MQSQFYTILDTSYILDTPIVHYKSEDYELTLELKKQPSNFLQLYTPEHRQSIAIEPMTALPNAFNLDYIDPESPTGIASEVKQFLIHLKIAGGIANLSAATFFDYST